ncbi:MAG: type II secretion system secretin GspD [Synergistaceae bacterium]|nr:type II secretion system secretin GspD [Synergistaceae bacterium]
MKVFKYFILFLMISCITICFSCALSLAAEPENNDGPDEEPALILAAQRMRNAGVVHFNFSNIDIAKFIRFMSELLQENIIVPPGLTAKISLVSPKPIPLTEARQIMLSMLSMNNLSLQEMGSYTRLTTVPGPVLVENEFREGREGPGRGEQNVTQLVPLNYVTADYVISAIQQSTGQNVTAMPIGAGRDILLGGRASDVHRAINMIRGLDVASSLKQTKTFALQFADPTTVAAQLNELVKTGYLAGLTAMADAPSKKVIVVAERDILERAARFIKELDIDMRDTDFHIYKLKNVNAKTTAEQMSSILAAAARMQPGADATKPPPTVVPDLTTNSLIFSASWAQFESLKKILDQIDVQPKQVLLRGLIAEVNLSNLDRAGIDWSTFGGNIFGDAVFGSQINLGGGGVPGTFLDWFNKIMTDEEEVIDAHGNIRYKTVTHAAALMYAYVELLKQFDAINVLSMPRIMCMDNQESTFQIGDVIPVLKGTASDLSNPNAIQTNYDYKPTGITLTVTPQIRSGNLVALDIVQTTEDVKSSGATPTTLKREIKTSVLVSNGDTVILGGLVREMETTLRQKVPGFSYIPLIGGLFSKTIKQHQKIDFMMFLTPYIVESPEQIQPITKGIVLSGDMGLSEAERAVQLRLEELFRKSQQKR